METSSAVSSNIPDIKILNSGAARRNNGDLIYVFEDENEGLKYITLRGFTFYF